MALTEEEKRARRNEASKRWYQAHKAMKAKPKKAIVPVKGPNLEKDLARFEKKYGEFKSDVKEMLKTAQELFKTAAKADPKVLAKTRICLSKCGIVVGNQGRDLVLDDKLKRSIGLKLEKPVEPEVEPEKDAEDEVRPADDAEIDEIIKANDAEAEDENEFDEDENEFDEDDENENEDDEFEDDEDDILGGAGRRELDWGRGREEMFDEFSAMGCDDE